MDDDSCILKYIEIVPLENRLIVKKDVTSVRRQPATVKVVVFLVLTLFT